MLEPKVLFECYINDLYSHSDKRPTFVADFGLVTACTDIIVICHIDIENELFL